ncbi:TetR-like C-terminal domain-containing protein [Nonomuraea sp. NPDC050404]|uniref:TetR-like C-terminal domain-containing protein n=1 Tax=Nonomuraea sp. NPDC050404 TaxID=3155783 RepID=UPI0033F71773
MEAQRRPLGRRGEGFRSAVLSATVDLLVTEGVEATTVAAVSAAAGVHESSIYRRWGTWERLISEAVGHGTDEAVLMSDTGDVERDLRLYATSLLRFLTSPVGQALLRIGARPPSDPALTHASEFWDTRLRRASAIVGRAIDRGELRADCDPRLLIQTIIGTLTAKVLFYGDLAQDDAADRLVGQLLSGVRAPRA